MSVRVARPGWRFVLFATLSLVLTGFIAGQIVDAGFADHYELTARLDDATGLEEGDDVRVAGVPVGSVRAVRAVEGRAELTLGVRSDVSLPTDTRAEISWVDLTGSSQVDLVPGQADAELTAGDAIERTRSSAGVGRLAADLGAFVGAFDPEQLNELLSSVQRILDGNEQRLVTLVHDLGDLMEVVTDREDAVETMLADYAEVAETAVARERQLRGIVDDLVALTEAFDQSEEALGSGLEAATALTRETGDFLDANQQQLEAMLDDIGVLLALLRPRLDDLEAGMAQLPETLARLYGAVRHGEYLRVDAVCASLTEPPCPAFRDGLVVPGSSGDGTSESRPEDAQ